MSQNPGLLALVGSGEYSLQMQEFETGLLRSASLRGKKNLYIQIPTASSHEGEGKREYWRKRGQEQIDRIKCESLYLPIHDERTG